ncbi:Gfo/Idh/MocA family protein [Subtercola endophyticus]|uniref:Gfo/Idh/MocA family protein n=1 Tax=Subtercola endophyticus TaxID=2895559 RepID=UPI001E5B7FB8|nr:Gfo/Idh/MocA family oxidoreductase [Subtercola endophyticus]UFS58816.1 Gfo/Idh/MocA family oxidoreductase [Subtercola endophyticus]
MSSDVTTVVDAQHSVPALTGTVRWGVLGSAWINEVAIPGILRAPNATLAAVSSRRPEQAQLDAERWGAEKAYSSYDELLADPTIDAVYIPVPNALHVEWTVKALQAGKHVLCEKPLALGLAEAELVAAAAAEADRYVLEAFMYRFAPRWHRAAEIVAEGLIGEPRVARLSMGFKQFYEGYNIRFDPAQGGGVIWDMGCYVVNKSRMIFGREPVSVSATAFTRPGENVETTANIVLDFGNGQSSVCNVSFDYINTFSLDEIVGTDGWVNMPGTGMRGEPYSQLQWYRWDDELFIDGAVPVVETFEFSDNFELEVQHLSEAILAGHAPKYGAADALANARVLNAVFTSIAEKRLVELG